MYHHVVSQSNDPHFVMAHRFSEVSLYQNRRKTCETSGSWELWKEKGWSATGLMEGFLQLGGFLLSHRRLLVKFVDHPRLCAVPERWSHEKRGATERLVPLDLFFLKLAFAVQQEMARVGHKMTPIGINPLSDASMMWCFCGIFAHEDPAKSCAKSTMEHTFPRLNHE